MRAYSVYIRRRHQGEETRPPFTLQEKLRPRGEGHGQGHSLKQNQVYPEHWSSLCHSTGLHLPHACPGTPRCWVVAPVMFCMWWVHVNTFWGDTAQAGLSEWWRWNLEPGLGMGLGFVPRIMDSVPCGELDIWGACTVGG